MPYCGDPWCGNCGRYGRLDEDIERAEQKLEDFLDENPKPEDRKERATWSLRQTTLQTRIDRAKRALNDLLIKDKKAQVERLEKENANIGR